MKFRVTIKITSTVGAPGEFGMRTPLRKWLGSIVRWIWEWEIRVPVGQR